MKKIILLLVLVLSVVWVKAQDEEQLFEKEYKFPLSMDNGKCSVSGAMDFSATKLDDDAIFTNLYMWVCENMVRENVLKILPSKKIIVCKYSIEGKTVAVTGKKNTYNLSTAFRIADKRVYVSPTEIEVLPALPFAKKGGIEKYAALKKPADKTVIDEFNEVNNEMILTVSGFIESNTPHHINNWDNIVAKRVVEGMTMTEVKLALGNPQSEVEGNTETQWIYGLTLIIYFDDGKTGEKKVTRILR